MRSGRHYPPGNETGRLHTTVLMSGSATSESNQHCYRHYTPREEVDHGARCDTNPAVSPVGRYVLFLDLQLLNTLKI